MAAELQQRERLLTETEENVETLTSQLEAVQLSHEQLTQRQAEAEEQARQLAAELRDRDRTVSHVEETTDVLMDQIRQVSVETERRLQSLSQVKSELHALADRRASGSRNEDLTVIKGIGKRKQERLSLLGVTSLEQVAHMDGSEERWLDRVLGLEGDIRRRGWKAQAQRILHARDEARDDD